MSENNGDPFAEASERFSQGQNQFAKMWTDFAGKMATAGVSFAPESTPPDAAKQMRGAFFKALSDYCEEYMRSPEFLDSWKQAMDGAIQFRRQMNESLGKMHHELGGTSRQDVDRTMIAISHLERRLVDTMERAAERVDEVAGRVDALEKKMNGSSPGRSGPAKRKAPAKKASAKKKTAKKKVAAKKKKPAAKRTRATRKK